jgi:hypothetical protein
LAIGLWKELKHLFGLETSLHHTEDCSLLSGITGLSSEKQSVLCEVATRCPWGDLLEVKARALGNEADLLDFGAEPQGSEAGLLLGLEAVPKDPKAEPRRSEADPLGLEADLTKWLHVSLGAKDGLMRQSVVEGEKDDILLIWPRSLNAEKGEYDLLLSFYLQLSNNSFKSFCLS